jgi:hypothetical protein
MKHCEDLGLRDLTEPKDSLQGEVLQPEPYSITGQILKTLPVKCSLIAADADWTSRDGAPEKSCYGCGKSFQNGGIG